MESSDSARKRSGSRSTTGFSLNRSNQNYFDRENQSINPRIIAIARRACFISISFSVEIWSYVAALETPLKLTDTIILITRKKVPTNRNPKMICIY